MKKSQNKAINASVIETSSAIIPSYLYHYILLGFLCIGLVFVLLSVFNNQNSTKVYAENNVVIYNTSIPINNDLLKKAVGFEEDIESDIVKLYSDFYNINSDVTAYLRIRNSTMNFPLVQKVEPCSAHHIVDNCYYLYRDIYKRNAVNTNAISFIDGNSVLGKSIKEFDQNVVIYGHTWNNGERNGKSPRIGDISDKQLGQLVSYTDIAWLKSHPVLELTTGVERSYWIPQNIVYTDCVRTNNPDGFNYMKRNLTQEDINTFKERSVISNTVDVLVDTDKLLTLSTCNYKYGNDGDNRFVVVFKYIAVSTYNEALELANSQTYIEQSNVVTW